MLYHPQKKPPPFLFPIPRLLFLATCWRYGLGNGTLRCMNNPTSTEFLGWGCTRVLILLAVLWYRHSTPGEPRKLRTVLTAKLPKSFLGNRISLRKLLFPY